MTRLTREDVRKLQLTNIKTTITNEMLEMGQGSVIIEQMIEQAIENISHANFLPPSEISTAELSVETRPIKDLNATEHFFRWGPKFEDFKSELVGGPRDGEQLIIPERDRGQLDIHMQSAPIFETSSDATAPNVRGRYKEAGWDTEAKVWIYEWQGTF